ncbi:MAG: Tex-like N-terminal domain-containing protein, partial [Aristaeellaceae bacterium]
MTIVETLCAEFHIAPWQAEAVIRLLDEGCTLPFIARYRKEQHGELDDQKLRDIADRLTALRNLESRRSEIAESLKKLEVWTEELQAALDQATTMGQLEDIYRPYRPKRRTRAMIAREKGLAPLADMLLLQLSKAKTAEELAAGYVDPEKGVATAEDALQGAMDIIAEKISDDPALRTKLKALCRRDGVMATRPAGEEDSVYRMYYDRSEPW